MKKLIYFLAFILFANLAYADPNDFRRIRQYNPININSGNSQGNGALFQLSTGSATSGDFVKYDANGNVIDAGFAAVDPSNAGNITSGTLPAARLPSPFVNYQTGRWYSVLIGNTTGNGGGQANHAMIAHDIVVNSSTGSETFKACGVHVVTGGASSLMTCGIYDSTGTNGAPNNLLGNCTTAVATTTSSADATCTLGSTVTLNNGVYKVFAVFDNNSGAMPIVSTTNTVGNLLFWQGALNIGSYTNDAGTYWTSSAITWTAGSTTVFTIPSTWGTATRQETNPNAVLTWLQAN